MAHGYDRLAAVALSPPEKQAVDGKAHEQHVNAVGAREKQTLARAQGGDAYQATEASPERARYPQV